MSNLNHIQKFLDHIKYEKRYSDHTLKSYSNDLIKFCLYLENVYGGVDLTVVELLHVRSYMVSLLEKKMAKSSVARKVSAVKSLFKYLVKKQLILSSPVSFIETPKLDKRLPTFIKEDEISNLLNKIDFEDSFSGFRDRLLITMFYQTGIRLSEIIGLDVNSVREFEVKVIGKRNKERIIPLSRVVSSLVGKYNELKLNKFPEARSFFITDSGNKMYEKFVYRKVNYYLSLVSSKQQKSPHILRHTFATHMLNNGADLNAIKELLGHQSLSATQVYTHNTFQKLKSIHEKSHPRG